MATFTWYYYGGATPSWVSFTNTIVFASSTTDLTQPITVGSYNDGTHIGNGDPGTDQCGTNHCRNVKYISSTQFDSGGGTETLNNTNLAATECTLEIVFSDASSVSITNARVYAYNSTTTTTRATGVTMYAFEAQVAASTWKKVNDDGGAIGGDNASDHLDLVDQGAATSHTYYVALSISPQSVGGKPDVEVGIALTYS